MSQHDEPQKPQEREPAQPRPDADVNQGRGYGDNQLEDADEKQSGE